MTKRVNLHRDTREQYADYSKADIAITRSVAHYTNDETKSSERHNMGGGRPTSLGGLAIGWWLWCRGRELHAFLNQHRVNTLIISGGKTDVCVLATVLTAVDHGYRVILAEDALCSSSDQSHDALMDLYRQRFDIQIEVASTQDILGCWNI